MEIYPSIDTLITNIPIIAFDKLDGSNIRAEWKRRRPIAFKVKNRAWLDKLKAKMW